MCKIHSARDKIHILKNTALELKFDAYSFDLKFADPINEGIRSIFLSTENESIDAVFSF
jgi:hypothetical protein